MITKSEQSKSYIETKNSSIKYDFIASFKIMEKNSHWGKFNYRTFIQLSPFEDFKKVEITLFILKLSSLGI